MAGDPAHYDEDLDKVLALFPRIPGMDLALATDMLNDQVDWEELGFVCDGRFLFTQRSLQGCLPIAWWMREARPEAGPRAQVIGARRSNT